jgi:DNA-directed RNA polymerase subunit RPC12/RpoP
MVEAEESKLCKNCERNIELSKFRMHEIQCARINYKCGECGMIVAKTDKEDHEREAHVQIKCQYCAFEAGKLKFGNHEDRCELRPKPCDYCKQIFKIERWCDHVEQCAVKTSKC